MLNINNEKMSKSLGNFILARDLIQHYGGELIRFFMLQGHYRNPINFSDDLLEQAANGLERIKTAYANLRHRLETARPQEPNGLAEEQARTISQLREQFIAEMDDDLNTANAITVVYEVVKEANLYLRNQNVGREQVEQYLSLLTELTSVLGVQLEQAEELLDSEVEALIGERTEARRLRNFARADKIRDLLSEKGIVLEDTPQGVRWRRK